MPESWMVNSTRPPLLAVEDAGFEVLNVREIQGKEVPGGFVSPFLRESFSDVNFSLIVLTKKC